MHDANEGAAQLRCTTTPDTQRGQLSHGDVVHQALAKGHNQDTTAGKGEVRASQVGLTSVEYVAVIDI